MKVLVTGFDAFAGVPVNPSALMLDELAALCRGGALSGVETRLLPTEYGSAGGMISDLIGSLKPDVVIATGVAQFRQNITIERIALNIDDAAAPDNAGDLRRGTPVDPGGPLALMSSCDTDALAAVLRQSGFPAEVSNHAGTYVCNHVYYAALACAAGLQPAPLCVFVHVPIVGEAAPDAAGAWSITRLVGAVKVVIGQLAPVCLAREGGHSP